MNKKTGSLSTKKMVSSSKGRNKVISCSTPEHESPSRDSDSICDSEAASPVPFYCTQDGAEGETDVVWNYYSPKAETSTSRLNSTPLSRKGKKFIKKTVIEKRLPKRRALVRPTQKTTELFQDLIELNQNIHKLMEKKSVPVMGDSASDKPQSGSEDDIFSNSSDCSPKSTLRTNNRCLRKNLLSSKFGKPESETALESDDSMNECLIKASQIVEENILKPEPLPSRVSNVHFQDSMDGLLTNIRLEASFFSKTRNHESPGLKNDSFDSFVGNLNDSALERLTQMPAKNDSPLRSRRTKTNGTTDWTLQELTVHESPSNSKFGRHSSMPESPSVKDLSKPSTSGMIFGRHYSMPYSKESNAESGDSPIRCTPEEIKKKHLQAREKLLAKRLLPFTSSQQPHQITQSSNASVSAPKKSCFQPKIATQSNNASVSAPKKSCFQPKISSTSTKLPPVNGNIDNNSVNKKMNMNKSDDTELKRLIEKKRQEALMKLRRKQSR